MEVCVESVQSAINAESGGAIRLELCTNLSEGGTTPSVGLLQVIKEKCRLPVMAMLRPRGGDFIYTDDELEVIRKDLLALKQSGADGFVLGILKTDGTVDENKCHDLVELAKPLPVTFHRAIDMTCDLTEAMEAVIRCQCCRILTSGGYATAEKGIDNIKMMIQQAAGRISVMPGSGITCENLQKILEVSGATEFHGSARVTRESVMTYRRPDVQMGSSSGKEYTYKVTDEEVVKKMVSIANTYWHKKNPS